MLRGVLVLRRSSICPASIHTSDLGRFGLSPEIGDSYLGGPAFCRQGPHLEDLDVDTLSKLDMEAVSKMVQQWKQKNENGSFLETDSFQLQETNVSGSELEEQLQGSSLHKRKVLLSGEIELNSKVPSIIHRIGGTPRQQDISKEGKESFIFLDSWSKQEPAQHEYAGKIQFALCGFLSIHGVRL